MKYRRVLPQVFFAILVVLFVLLNNSGENKMNNSRRGNTDAPAEKETARVIRVIDGDTIEVSLGGKKETVRLVGIDSPEVLDERKPVQCFGEEASSKTKEVLNGKEIILEPDPTQGDRDEYGRLLRYVLLNGLNFNKFMISEGYAQEYTFKNNAYKYQEEFVQAERKARENEMGLWSGCK